MSPGYRIIPLVLALPLMGAVLRRYEFGRTDLFFPASLGFGCLAVLIYNRTRPLRGRGWKCIRWWTYPGSILPALVWTIVLTTLPSMLRGSYPTPFSQDEFSYLLAADTFAHGRLTNSTPQGHIHFETHQETVTPSYHSKYQPGMGLILAAGQVLAGHPFVGQVLALALATVALLWMFHVWLPARWSLAATLLASLPMIMSWGDNYFAGGPLAVLAGALLMGTFRLMLERGIRWQDGLLLGLASVIYFWTRTFEGAVVCVTLGLLTAWHLVTHNSIPKLLLLIGTSLVVVIPAMIFQLKFNEACVGDPWTLPYTVYERQYAITPPFLFQKPPPIPNYHHDIIRRFHEVTLHGFQRQFNVTNWFTDVLPYKFGMAWFYFFFMLWIFPLCCWPELVRDRWSRLALIVWCALFLTMQCVSWMLHHYLAPAFPAWAVVVFMSLRHAQTWRYQGKRIGRSIVVFAVTSFVAFVLLNMWAKTFLVGNTWSDIRALVIEQVASQPGKHLLLVEYAPDHQPAKEWIYNSADIEQQPVLLARSMSPEQNRQLLAMYPDRKPWRVVADSSKSVVPFVVPYRVGVPPSGGKRLEGSGSSNQ